MKTPIDSAAAGAGATTTLLNGGSRFVMADLWKITLNGGTVVRWHSAAGNSLLTADRSYSFTAAGGQSTAANGTYLKGPLIDRGKISTKLGLEVATLDLTISAALTDLINGTSLIPFASARGFDGATVQLFRAYLPDWNSPITGVTIAFSGRVTSLKDISRSQFTMTVSAWTVLLNVNMGPDVFQAGCLNTHFDANCGLSPAGFTFAGVASGMPTTKSIAATGAASSQPDHYFDRGKVTFTSGPNTGISRTVQSFVGGVFTFAFGFPAAPAAGNTFNAVRGCLLTMADCTAQSNLIHFRGQPFTPPAVQGVVG